VQRALIVRAADQAHHRHKVELLLVNPGASGIARLRTDGAGNRYRSRSSKAHCNRDDWRPGQRNIAHIARAPGALCYVRSRTAQGCREGGGATEGSGMTLYHRIILALMSLVLTGHSSTAFARGGLSNRDPPSSSERIDRLPEEVRNAVVRLCAERPSAAHYFATYSENSRLMNLHFEHFQCQTNKAFCTQEGCLRQVYILREGHYRLLRSYYGPGSD
jgi:hypothetical protein